MILLEWFPAIELVTIVARKQVKKWMFYWINRQCGE